MTTSRRDPAVPLFMAMALSLVLFAAWNRSRGNGGGGSSVQRRPAIRLNASGSTTAATLSYVTAEALLLPPHALAKEEPSPSDNVTTSVMAAVGESAQDDERRAAEQTECSESSGCAPPPAMSIERLWASAAASDTARNLSVLYHHRYRLQNRSSERGHPVAGKREDEGLSDGDGDDDGVRWRNDVDRSRKVHVELEVFCRAESPWKPPSAPWGAEGGGGGASVKRRNWRPSWGVNQALGWNAFGQHRLCIRGREIFAGYVGAAVEPRSEPLENQTGGGRLTASVPSPVAPQKIRWQLNRRRVTIRPISDVSATPFPYRGTVHLHRGLGVVASVYFQAFHVLGNTVLPLYQLFRRWCNGSAPTLDEPLSPPFSLTSESPSDDGAAGLTHDDRRDANEATCPVWDLYLYRELPGGAKLVGGEDFSLLIAAGFATRRATILRSVTEGGQDTSVTHCYCHGMLHNMLDISTVPATHKIVFGDAMRRSATRFLKEQLNERFRFLPYGTVGPVPSAELSDFGLWNSQPAAAAATPPPPRLLLVLRNFTRVLGDAAAVRKLAERIGFHVQVMFPEHVPLPIQARAARYADVLMGVHGQALTWSFMMDGTRATHCREVIELAFFGRPLRGVHNCFEVMAADSNLLYTRILPTHVQWLVNCTANAKGCRSWHTTMLSTNFPQKQTAFFKQKVFFHSNPKLERALAAAYDRVRRCAWKQLAVDIPPRYVVASGRATARY